MQIALPYDEFAGLIAYARREIPEERYPCSPALRRVREALAKLDPKPEPEPPPPRKPFEPSTALRKKRG